jgi:hypothetical protein
MNDAVTPKRVRRAVVLLWFAWSVAFIAIVVGCALSFSLGFVLSKIFGVAFQAILILFIARGSRAARVLLFAMLLLETLVLLSAVVDLAETSLLFALVPVVSFILRVVALYFLVTGESRAWFACRSFFTGTANSPNSALEPTLTAP